MRILEVLCVMLFVFGKLYAAFYTEQLLEDAAAKLLKGFLLPSTGNFASFF
jgi:hypothetical protein